MDDGYLTLRFQDGSFKTPFLDRYVSDGTIKMFAYLVLLHDPRPHPLLCVEEPENQLYPQLMAELAEEFRGYANRGGQVFVTTHSPDFLNALELDEVCWLVKREGCTEIHRAKEQRADRRLRRRGRSARISVEAGFLRRGGSAMRELVFLLEERSASAMLESMLPRMLDQSISVRCVPFEGKQDLEKQLTRRIRAYQSRSARFIVVRDQDSNPDCIAVKRRVA